MIPLIAIPDDALGTVGGKAAKLARLVREGVAVPEAAVLPVEAFQDALRTHGLWARAEAVAGGASDPGLADAIRTLPLSRDLHQQWVAAARGLGRRLAVRSSGTDEDGEETSFAGQHKTLLDVPPEDVPDAVLTCWASLYADRALAYRRTPPAPGALAVLVQRQLTPTISGVLFTINPLNGSWREMVVEAVWGLGEVLVSGQVHPHWYLVRRPRTLPAPLRSLQRITARVRLQVLQRDLPDLAQQLLPSEAGGPELVAVPAPQRGRPTLSDRALRRLCRTGLAVERLLDGPQDIEWAIEGGQLYLLQARPITAAGSPRSRDDVIWTRRFIGERWPRPATPMGWSVIAPILDELVAYPETQAAHLGGGPALQLVDGHPYVNATVFRHLAFKLPGAPAPRFMLELIPPEEERAWRRRFAVAPHLAVYASILRTTLQERRWRRFRWNPFTNDRAWERFDADLADALPRLTDPRVDPETQLAEQLDWIRAYCGIHVCSLLFANIGYQLLEGSLAAWLPNRRDELLALFGSSAEGNRTVETHHALENLRLHATDEDRSRLAEGQAEGLFADTLAGFLDAYGHRAEASWELMAPHWRDDPSQLVPLLENPITPPAPVRQEQVDAALAELDGELSASQKATLKLLVERVRTYMRLRENQRFTFDRLLQATRDTVLRLGDRLVGSGVIDDRALVAFLDLPTVQRALRDGGDLQATAEAARGEWERQAQQHPPAFLSGSEPPPATSGRLQGLGISPGRHRGRVRVIRDLAEGAALLPGEILVAHAVDPGWTPLFARAGAAVLELGSVLSHGAVVAREYGLPAVVNIDDATLRLTNGTDITVDGQRGAIWIHDPQP